MLYHNWQEHWKRLIAPPTSWWLQPHQASMWIATSSSCYKGGGQACRPPYRERTTLPTFAGPPHRRERGPPCQSPPFIPAQQREREDHPASLPLSHVSGDHTTSLKGRLASSDDGTEAYLRRGPGGFNVYALLPSRGAFGRALQIQEDSKFVVEKSWLVKSGPDRVPL